MPYSMRYDSARHFIRISVTSSLDAAVATSLARDAVTLGSRHNCKALLIDFREAVIVEGTLGIYNFANSLPGLGVSRDTRIASIVAENDPDHRFYETVARNRGYDVKYFTDPKLAESWLDRAPSASNGDKGGARGPRSDFKPSSLT